MICRYFFIGDPNRPSTVSAGPESSPILRPSGAGAALHPLDQLSLRPASPCGDQCSVRRARQPVCLRRVEYRTVKAGLPGGETALCIDGERQAPFTLWLQTRDDDTAVEGLSQEAGGPRHRRAVASEIASLLVASRERGGYRNGRYDLRTLRYWSGPTGPQQRTRFCLPQGFPPFFP